MLFKSIQSIVKSSNSSKVSATATTTTTFSKNDIQLLNLNVDLSPLLKLDVNL